MDGWQLKSTWKKLSTVSIGTSLKILLKLSASFLTCSYYHELYHWVYFPIQWNDIWIPHLGPLQDRMYCLTLLAFAVLSSEIAKTLEFDICEGNTPSSTSFHLLDSPSCSVDSSQHRRRFMLKRKTASIGGLLRNSSGHWLGGFNRTIGYSNAFQAELWAIHDGLCLAWDLGYRFLQVRSDCLKAIAIINDPNALSCQLPLVRAITLLRQRSCTYSYVS
ncbi:hypothetical protein F3Y22_tig00011718pilonHSYRG00078 [Hibiscus syriacus]|uniref:RNase H type-1 domain-containing protein n=1 Tax=Hibiscus syriacus TaxID=106335 RepID=A0A6A3C3Q0_HIBSY|nr:hypothetical protein F3Y22_tig00011718pilonHSYRG00078 [Hibiscus syriacus]